GGQECYTPGNAFYVASKQVVLGDYTPQAYGQFTTFNVTLVVPATGFIYLNMHLDYGLKKSTGYTADASGNALDSSLAIVIPNGGSYMFSATIGAEVSS